MERTVDRFATIVRVVCRIQARLRAVTEPSDICSVNTILPFPVQILLLFGQTGIANIFYQIARNRLALVVRIELPFCLRIPEFAKIALVTREFALSVLDFFSGRQAGEAYMFDKVVCKPSVAVRLSQEFVHTRNSLPIVIRIACGSHDGCCS